MLSPEVKQKRTKTPDEAAAALMRLAARAEKCRSDARRLMHLWGLAPQDAEKVLERLVAERFIDDERYAGAFVREKLRLSGWGEYKIRAALSRKQIAKEIIDRAMSQAPADAAAMARRLEQQLQRKARSVRSDTPYELKTKLIRYGISLGYDYETVMETADKMVKIK